MLIIEAFLSPILIIILLKTEIYIYISKEGNLHLRMMHQGYPTSARYTRI